MIDQAEIPLREVLEGALQYMKESETAARRSCGYPKDLERCLEYQIAAHAALIAMCASPDKGNLT